MSCNQEDVQQVFANDCYYAFFHCLCFAFQHMTYKLMYVIIKAVIEINI